MSDPKTQAEIAGVPGFWSLVSKASHAILLLDYDGTLAPFHPDRMQAKPLDGVLTALNQLSSTDGVTIALISGRPVNEIQQLTGMHNVTIAGTHGFEIYRPGRGTQRLASPPEVLQKLDAIENIAVDIVGTSLAERKIATVALHTRKMEPEQAREAEAAFRTAIEPLLDPEIEARAFDGGVEARVRGRDKGVAVLELIDEMPLADLVVYVGDDDTDEDAFRALAGRGVGIKVGSPEASTAATGRLSTCNDVLQLLTDWIETRKC